MPQSKEKKFYKKYINFTLFIPELSALGVRSWNLQFLVSLPYKCFIPNCVTMGHVGLEEKMLAHHGWETTTTPIHCNRNMGKRHGVGNIRHNYYRVTLQTVYVLPSIGTIACVGSIAIYTGSIVLTGVEITFIYICSIRIQFNVY